MGFQVIKREVFFILDCHCLRDKPLVGTLFKCTQAVPQTVREITSVKY